MLSTCTSSGELRLECSLWVISGHREATRANDGVGSLVQEKFPWVSVVRLTAVSRGDRGVCAGRRVSRAGTATTIPTHGHDVNDRSKLVRRAHCILADNAFGKSSASGAPRLRNFLISASSVNTRWRNAASWRSKGAHVSSSNTARASPISSSNVTSLGNQACKLFHKPRLQARHCLRHSRLAFDPLGRPASIAFLELASNTLVVRLARLTQDFINRQFRR